MFRKIGKHLCRYTDNQPGTVLRIYDGTDFVSGARALKLYVRREPYVKTITDIGRKKGVAGEWGLPIGRD